MSLESTYIIVDNSESMRNGDYLPTRFEGQADTVNLLANAKTSQNPESTVGLISMAGKRVEVLQTLSQDPTDVLSALHKVQISGEADISAALQVAQLALKHRQNKNGGQRVVLFIGSPIKEDAKALAKLGKKLKKNGIALDVISVGDELEASEQIEALMQAVNDKSGTSHHVHVPAGAGMIADILVSTPIFFSTGDEGGAGGAEAGGAAAGGGGAGAGAGAGGGAGRPGMVMGVDPNVDPDLYEAIQMSLREQQERESAGAPAKAGGQPAAAAGDNKGAAANSNNNSNNNNNNNNAAAAGGAAPASSQPGGVVPMDMDDMDEEMRKAIALSMMAEGQDDLYAPGAGGSGAASGKPGAGAAAAPDADEDEGLKLSLALAEQAQKEEAVKAALQNQDYVKDLFGGLPVDLDDASIQAALETITKGEDPNKKDESKKDESDPKRTKKDDENKK